MKKSSIPEYKRLLIYLREITWRNSLLLFRG